MSSVVRKTTWTLPSVSMRCSATFLNCLSDPSACNCLVSSVNFKTTPGAYIEVSCFKFELTLNLTWKSELKIRVCHAEEKQCVLVYLKLVLVSCVLTGTRFVPWRAPPRKLLRKRE